MTHPTSPGTVGLLRIVRSNALILLVVFSWAVGVPQARAAEAVVTDVAIDVDRRAARFVLRLDRPVAFRLFTLADPYRVVLDLPEVGWRLPTRPLPGANGIFSRLRYGLFEPGNSRVVFDFAQPVAVDDAYIALDENRRSYNLVLETVRTTHDRFMASVKKPPREVASVRPRAEIVAARAEEPPDTPSVSRLESVKRRTAALIGTANAAPLPPSRPEPASAVKQARYLPLPPRRPGAVPMGSRPMVVIDPGHGGVDPGALGGRGIYEKHVVLAMSREIRRQLQNTRRYRAALTRDRDVFIRLRDRVAIARKKGADMFISVHADSIRNKTVSGPSVYTLSETASDKEAAELAERENKADLIAGVDLTHENADVTNILIDLAQRETMNQSARFAGLLVQELGNHTKVLPRPHRFAGFAVLKAPDLPSVLVETGFLSNREDKRRLTSRQYRRRLATAIVAAIDRYFGSVEQAKAR